MRNLFVLGVAAVALHIPSVAAAQPGLELQIAGGRVTLHADNVPIRQILTRWADVGRVTIVNADKIPDAAITIQLDHVQEHDAIAALLRDVGGYILGRRAGNSGAGWIDRIVIVPVGAPPPAMAASVRPVPGARPQRLATVPAFSGQAAALDVTPEAKEDRFQDPDDLAGLGADDSAISDDTAEAPGGFQGAAIQGPQLGVVSGPERANTPTSGALDENDLSRYEGLNMGPGPGSRSEPAPVSVGANPFGVTSGAAAPGPATPRGSSTPSAPDPPRPANDGRR